MLSCFLSSQLSSNLFSLVCLLSSPLLSYLTSLFLSYPHLSLFALISSSNLSFPLSLFLSSCFLVSSPSSISFFHPVTSPPLLFHFLVPLVFLPLSLPVYFPIRSSSSYIPFSIPALFCLLYSSFLVSSSLLSSSPPTLSVHGHMLLCRWVPVLARLLLATTCCKGS